MPRTKNPSRQLPTPILNEVREMIRGIREASPDFDICIKCHGGLRYLGTSSAVPDHIRERAKPLP